MPLPRIGAHPDSTVLGGPRGCDHQGYASWDSGWKQVGFVIVDFHALPFPGALGLPDSVNSLIFLLRTF